MATIHLITSTDPLRLLEHAAEGFLVPRRGTGDAPFPTVPYLLALRQGGLRDDLMAMAQQRGVSGWFDPPLCVFTELPDWLGRSTRWPLDELERRVLLTQLLETTPLELLRRVRRREPVIEALDRWFGELAAEGVTPDRYEGAIANRRGDAFERRRDAELATLYRRYVEALGTTRRDGRDTLVDVSAELARRAGAPAERMDGRREVRLFGLHDLRGGWPVLLQELARSPFLERIVLYSAYRPERGLGSLAFRHEELPSGDGPASRLFTGLARSVTQVTVVEAPDPERELEEVARRVRALHDGGVSLRDIAVVVRRARPHGDLAVETLSRFGLPATARQRRRVLEVPVVRALLALFRAAEAGWTRHALVELADQPYFASELDSGVLNHAGFRARIAGLDDWETALAALARDALARDQSTPAAPPDDERHIPLPATERCDRTLEAFRRFAAIARSLEAPRPLAEWLAALGDLLGRDPWKLGQRAQTPPGGRFDVVGVDQRGWTALSHLVESWSTALRDWGGAAATLSTGEFLSRLEAALDGDVILRTPTAYGVQVVEGLAAAYRSFEHVFIAGLEAGQFPVRPTPSPLMGEGDREELRAAGLPLDLHGDWDERERELFRVLVASGRRGLTLSHARTDAGGSETIASAFLEAVGEAATVSHEPIPSSRVLTPGARLAADGEALRRAAHAVRVERLRESGAPSPWSGQITAPDLVAWLACEFGDEREWSPTQLESYAKCPWAYFSSRVLHLEKRAEPDDALDPTVRGRILHDALRGLYQRLGAGPESPVLLLEASRPQAMAALPAALDEALAEAGREHWLGHPSLLPAQRAELLRLLGGYIEFEIEENAKLDRARTNRGKQVPTGVTRHEVSFRGAILEQDGIRLNYRGFIDRVESGLEDRRYVAAVDYKTSSGSVPGPKGGVNAGWEDGVVLQVPLYLHALASKVGGIPTRVEYHAIRNREALKVLSLHRRDPKTGEIREDPVAFARLERALSDAVGHVRRLRAGQFPPVPPPSCKCPPFCHAWEICRTPGGPDEGHSP